MRRPGAESAVTVAEPLAVTAPFSSIVVQPWPPPPRRTGVFDSFNEVLSNLGKKNYLISYEMFFFVIFWRHRFPSRSHVGVPLASLISQGSKNEYVKPSGLGEKKFDKNRKITF